MDIDARGKACPAPVLLARDAIDAGEARIRITVDNTGSRENVKMFMESRGYEVIIEENGGDFILTGSGDPETAAQAPPDARAAEAYACPVPEGDGGDAPPRKIMVFVSSNCMGAGDDELGAKLMINFIKTLKEMGPDLWKLVMVNSGVTLATSGSPVLNELRDLEAGSTGVLVCGTCLDHFGLADKKQAGQTTNMLDIVTAMQLADSVIRP